MSSERRATSEKIAPLLMALREMSDQDGLFNQTVAERLGLNVTDFKCLSIISRLRPVTAGKLAEITGLTTGAITGVLDRLEKGKFIRRERDPVDRRQVRIEPNDERREDFEAIFRPFEKQMIALSADYDAKQLETVLSFLQGMRGMLEEQTLRLRATLPGREAAREDELSSPLGAIERGRLRFVAGAGLLRVEVDRRMHDLYRVKFDGRPAQVKHDEGTVTISYARGGSLFDWRRVSATVTLNGTIPWHLEIRGGMSKFDADLSDLELSGIEVTGGASEVNATLPHPTGVVPVKVTGGVSSVSFHRPKGTPVQVQIRGGVSSLTLDEQTISNLGGPTRLTSDNFRGAADRYEIDLSGGVSQLSVDER